MQWYLDNYNILTNKFFLENAVWKSFGDLLDLEIKLKPRFLYVLKSKNLMNCCCQLHANYALKQSFCLHFQDSIKLMSQTYEILLHNQSRRGKKILDWQLFRNIETAYKYDPKMNKTQSLLKNENLLSVGTLYSGNKLRVAYVKDGMVLI